MTKLIGKRIQEFRKKRGLTQEQLSEMIDVTPHFLSSLERGVYNIKLETLVRILNCLDISADEVFADVVNKSSVHKAGVLSEKVEGLPAEERAKIIAVVEALLPKEEK